MSKYILNDEKMFSDISDGIAIVINNENGLYYGMNSFGTEVFQAILNGMSKAEIIEKVRLFSKYPKDFETNLDFFIQKLFSLEIIIYGSPEKKDCSLNEETALQDSYSLEIKEYVDAQELLLADPIHEVKEDTGWTPEKDSIGYSKEETKLREEKVEK